MRNYLLLLPIMMMLALTAAAAPTVEKVEPPNWWTNATINPVRVLVTGTDLKNVKVITKNAALSASALHWSDNGHYLFFDLAIKPNAKPGLYKIGLTSGGATTEFDFEVVAKSAQTGRNQGYTPDDVIYFLIPDRFADGDVTNDDPPKSKGLYDRKQGRLYHGGDLQGVIDKLDYLKSLGVTAIWTTPVYDNNDKPDTKETYPGMPFTTGYHGYGATDMYAIDEHLGDAAKLRELIDKAHAAGLKVIQDQVANHTGPYHRWAADPPTPTWWNGTLENHLSNNWQKWTTMNPRATYQTQQRNIDGWFIDILPDFNQSDPEVEKYLIQNSLWWVEMYGFDSIRMDTLPHVPRSFWAKWGAAIHKEYPKVNILGELFDGDPALVAYFQAGRKGHDGLDTQIDTLYDYALFYPIRSAFARGGPIRDVSQMFARDWLYPNPNVLTTFIGLHDMERFMNEKGATIEGLKLAQTLIMTSRGTPLLYYGDEIAMPGGGDPDNRRDFPGGFPGDQQNAFAFAGRTDAENDVWSHVANLGKLRAGFAALRRGKTLDLLDAEQQSAYVRTTEKQAVLVVFNNDSKPAEVAFDVSMVKPLGMNAVLADRLGKLPDITITNGKVKFTMPARAAGVFTVK
ncbi:MAG: cyclomaltodextrinase N-terminal domain-containing protein [Acidobacteria bacterium]|nr:cyclomaltodextrinase N-terminal domain-containing protein [Acidobacteriota bacterium]